MPDGYICKIGELELANMMLKNVKKLQNIEACTFSSIKMPANSSWHTLQIKPCSNLDDNGLNLQNRSIQVIIHSFFN